MQDGSGEDASPNPGGTGKPGRRRGWTEPSPTQRALGLLVRREHSRKELIRKLAARGVAGEEADAAVVKLAAAGWQSDTRFAESLLRTRVTGGYGPLHIRAELATHGLDRDAISAALDAFEGDWVENARELVLRRYGDAVAVDPVLQRKAVNLLMRRGFDSACVRAASRLDRNG